MARGIGELIRRFPTEKEKLDALKGLSLTRPPQAFNTATEAEFEAAAREQRIQDTGFD